jgi:hypothetical protein
MKIQFIKSKMTIGPAQSVAMAQQPRPAPAPARACADRSARLASDSTEGRELQLAYLAAGDPPDRDERTNVLPMPTRIKASHFP